MTSNGNITKDFVTKLVKTCLIEPGNFICKLYRTDGITQDSPIEQLYANYYRPDPYDYLTVTPHEVSLRELNNFLSAHKQSYVDHLSTKHGGKYEKVDQAFDSLNCQGTLDTCVGTIMEILHTSIEEYADSLRLSLTINDDCTEFCNKIISSYNKFTSFIVIMEKRLPTLSEILSKIPSTNYPFSLWKHLHQQFIEIVLTSLMPLIVPMLTNGIAECRREAVEKAVKKGKDKEVRLSDYDKVLGMKAVVEMIAGASIDERTVHFMESTADNCGGPGYDAIEQVISAQTEELYKEYSRKGHVGIAWKTIVCNDMLAIERTLMPRSRKHMMDHCVKIAKQMWLVGEDQVQHKFLPDHVRDAEVRIYAQRLGINVISQINS